MKGLAIAFLALILWTAATSAGEVMTNEGRVIVAPEPASVKPSRKIQKRYKRHHHHRRPLRAHRAAVHSLRIVAVKTAAGTIHVAESAAERFRGFIADVWARGFRGPVHCFAPTGHIPNSLHHVGLACDFAQRGWNLTQRVMYHVGDIARKWGLRDGCTFRSRRDCGHIDTGRHA